MTTVDDSGVVVPGPWVETTSFKVSWFAARCEVSRHLMLDATAWSEARLVTEHKLRLNIAEMMRKYGYVPVGEPEMEVFDDTLSWVVEHRLRQRGMEDGSPVWQSIRQALAEDEADRAAAARGH